MIVGEVIAAALENHKHNVKAMGELMFEMHTRHGYPPDMTMKEYRGLDDRERMMVLHYYLVALMAHKRASGISEHRLEEQRSRNARLIENFCTTGEIGLY